MGCKAGRTVQPQMRPSTMRSRPGGAGTSEPPVADSSAPRGACGAVVGSLCQIGSSECLGSTRLHLRLFTDYRQVVTITRRTVLTAMSAAAAAQAQRRVPNWKPKLGVLCQYSDANLEFVKAEGFTSMQLRLDPAQTGRRRDRRHQRERSSAPGSTSRRWRWTATTSIRTPAKREKQNRYTVKCLELCGKLGIPNIGGQSGTIKGQPLQQQVDEIVRVYTEKYFPLCEKHKVRILWEPYAGGPNIATGPVGWEALFKAFEDSPHVGLQFDPSHLRVAVHGPGGGGARLRGQDLRRPPEGHRDPLARGAARRHSAGEQCPLVALPRAGHTGRWIGRASSRCWRRPATPAP